MSESQADRNERAVSKLLRDDAIHIVDPGDPGRTFCAGFASLLNTVSVADPRPDTGAGCWSCLVEVEKRRG